MTAQFYISKVDEVLQNKIWDLGGLKSYRLVAVTLLQKSDRPHRQESMNLFYLGSVMQEHKLSNSRLLIYPRVYSFTKGVGSLKLNLNVSRIGESLILDSWV